VANDAGVKSMDPPGKSKSTPGIVATRDERRCRDSGRRWH
jgi:hypothetical protein